MKSSLTYGAISTRNAVYGKIWDVVTPSTVLSDVQGQCLSWQRAFPYKGIGDGVGDQVVADAVNAAGEWPQISYAYFLEQRSYIEPKYGYVLRPPLSIIPHSLSFDHVTRHTRPVNLIHKPSPLRFLLRDNVVQEDVVISLRFPWDTNYFHFYNDVLGKMPIVERFLPERHIPLLVSKNLYGQRFFQAALARGLFRSRRLIVQDQFYVEANKVFFCQPITHARENFTYVTNAIGEQRPIGFSDRRIFLTRSPARGRHISNAMEIEQVCREYGFEVVDADDLTLDQQIALFARCRYVIGIHGAGLVNTIFAVGRRLGLLEIFPPDEVIVSFPWLCQQLGFAYDAVAAPSDPSRRDRRDPFYLPVDHLRDGIRRLVGMEGRSFSA